MSDKTLEEQIEYFRKAAKEYREKHGSVEAVVAPSSPIARLGITSIDNVRIVDEEITFVDTTDSGKPDVKLSDTMIYFHSDDHPMFGSRAVLDDDDWDDGWNDD